MEEVWSYLSNDQYELHSTKDEEVESTKEALAISVQVMKGTKGGKSFRLRGFWANQEVYMLVDSCSTNCFISEHLAVAVGGKVPLQQHVTVRVANGDLLLCSYELPDQLWCIQGSPSRLLSRYCH
jgi:predicted aspartyl protease